MSDLNRSLSALTLDGVSDEAIGPALQSSKLNSERQFAFLQKSQKGTALQASFSLELPWTDPVVGPLSSRLDVRIPSAKNIANDLQWLMSSPVQAGDFQRCLLGINLEKSSTGELMLFQLCTASRCVLVRWRGLGHPEASEGLQVLNQLLADDDWAKVGCKLREVAIDVLFDSCSQLRLCNGFEVIPSSLARPDVGKHRGMVGLVTAFNERHGTDLKEDIEAAHYNWDKLKWSQKQLDYASLNAWMSYRLGAANDGALLKYALKVKISVGDNNELLAAAGRLLRECRVFSDSSKAPTDSTFSECTWQEHGAKFRLEVLMAQYENKMHRGDVVEVTVAGSLIPWIGYVIEVRGRTAVIMEVKSERCDQVGHHEATVDVETMSEVQRLVKRIVVVDSRDTTEIIYDKLVDLASNEPRGFITQHVLGSVRQSPPPRCSPLVNGAMPLPWRLNAAQSECVEDIKSGTSSTLTLGPPGTGKTTTIAAVAWTLATLDIEKKSGIVIVTQQNVAALNVLKALVDGKKFCNVRLIISRDFYFEWHEHEYDEEYTEYIYVTGKGHNLPQNPQRSEITIMTFGVLPSAEQIPEFSPKQISALLVDEASQVWSALGLLADAKLPNLKRVHLFGDDKQLPPVLAPCDKSQRAIMASKHVQSLYDVAKFGGHKLHELYVQHRMPAVLADFISRRIYDGLLQSAAHVSTARNAVTWMGAAHGRMSHPGQSQSPFNNTEARLVDRLVRKLDLLLGAAGTGVILTPFTGQRRELERVCTRSRNNGGRWDVKTVDSFQGREADFVVVSLVRTDGIAGFLKDDRRNNVMLSRARRHLFVVGHHQAWARVKGSALWREFAEQFPPAPNCEALCTNLDITRALQLCAE